MDYKSGEIYLDSRKRELIANAICTQIRQISKVRTECADLGISAGNLDWDIQNYQAILKNLGD